MTAHTNPPTGMERSRRAAGGVHGKPIAQQITAPSAPSTVARAVEDRQHYGSRRIDSATRESLSACDRPCPLQVRPRAKWRNSAESVEAGKRAACRDPHEEHGAEHHSVRKNRSNWRKLDGSAGGRFSQGKFGISDSVGTTSRPMAVFL
jgi:hypothetical protein